MATRSPRSEERARPDPNAPQSDRARVHKETRKERVPLGVPRARLSVPQRAGYRRRWINEDGKGRLQAALEGGYSHVSDPNLKVGEDGGASSTDSRVSRIVGRAEGGKPLRAFLMEIPREQYQEDQTSKRHALDEVDRAIRKGRISADGEENRYVPNAGKAIRVDKALTQTEGDEPNE